MSSPAHRTLYAAFDVYPSAKGAATHIHHMARTLFRFGGGGLLHVLGHPDLPDYQAEPDNVVIRRFSAAIPHYLDRAQAYMGHLDRTLGDLPDLQLCHYRDIWSALPVLQRKGKHVNVFEVNGLPSIELPYHYPQIGTKTLTKLRELEDHCLAESDQILTPAQVLKDNLIQRGVPPQKITVLPNGAEEPAFLDACPNLQQPFILYFGALQAWQGVDVLLKAFAGLQDFTDLRLVICASSRPRYIKAYRKLAEGLGIGKKVIWLYQLSKPELNLWIRQALISVAPLKETPRNLEQGCSPLKIFESWACGTAVVASDLPAVREILTDNVQGKLVRPDRPAVLSRALRFLLDEPAERQRIAEAGKDWVQQQYLWPKIEGQLLDYYRKILTLDPQQRENP